MPYNIAQSYPKVGLYSSRIESRVPGGWVVGWGGVVVEVVVVQTRVVPKVAKFPTDSRQLANFPINRESKSASLLNSVM